MSEFEITIKIAERPYKLTVKKEEEEVVRRAAKILEEKTKEYSKTFATEDKQNVLAMAALDVALAEVRHEKEDTFMRKTMQKKLNALDELLNENV
ncbi:MAG: cell division protein ZapA [Bacteroidota bacterium]|nr:cell division protein ZapA [Bacteroidota bacterium]